MVLVGHVHVFKLISSFSVASSDYMVLSNFRIRWLADQVDPIYIPTPSVNDLVFNVTIIDDEIPEPREEYFEIVLSLSPTGSRRNGFFYPSAVGRVTIIDDDICKLLIIIMITIAILDYQ